MPRRTLEEGTYHVYNRGFEKMIIFSNEKDYKKFFDLIQYYISLDEFKNIEIISYSVLPNHFHFLVFNPGVEKISKFFGNIQNAYAKYFNMKQARKGQLFEGRFKAKLISDDTYFEKCQAYVNYNAIKHDIVDNINDWPYSSIHDILDTGVKTDSRINIFGYSKNIEQYKDENQDLE